MGYVNLKISGKNGKMYESSSVEKVGYEKVLYGEKGSEKVTYHKYYDKIEGKFVGFGITQMKSDKADITMLNVKIQGLDDLFTIAVPLKTTYGGISDASKSLVSSFYNAKPQSEYSVTALVKKNQVGEKTYDNQVVYVNSLTEMGENGKGLSTGFIPFSEIPRPTKTDDGLGGISYDNKDVNLFFGGKIREISSKFEGVEPLKQKEEVKLNSQKTSLTVDDTDDLPF